MNNFYEILNLHPNATIEQIKNAYTTLIKKHHPDVGGDPEILKKVVDAYQTLSDPEKRKQYDESLKIKYQTQPEPHIPFYEMIKPSTITISKSKLLQVSIAIAIVIFILISAIVSRENNSNLEAMTSQTKELQQRLSGKEKDYSDLMIYYEKQKKQLDQLNRENNQLRLQINTQNTQNQNSSDSFTLGSSTEEVKKIMGTPDGIDDYSVFTIWHYGHSEVKFNQNGKVNGWDNSEKNLKLK